MRKSELTRDITRLLWEVRHKDCKLLLNPIDKIVYPFDIEDDMLYAKTSINTQLLDDIWSNGNSINEVCIYDFNKTDSSCAALEIFLENGQVLFFDPSYEFGINFGGERIKQAWFLNCDNADLLERIKF